MADIVLYDNASIDVENKVFTPFAVYVTNSSSSDLATIMKDLADDAIAKEALKSFAEEFKNKFPKLSNKIKQRDTSIGGNDAVNRYPQWNEDDDIIPDELAVQDSPTGGMGMVYSETIDDRQQIMWMTFGVPRFTGLVDFINNSIDSRLADLINSGDKWSSVGKLIGTTVGTLIAFPILPILWLSDLAASFANYKVSRYCEFKATMPLYYKLVNGILAHLAVNMGLADTNLNDPNLAKDYNTEIIPDDEKNKLTEAKKVYIENGTTTELEDTAEGKNDGNLYAKLGCDILKLLSRKDFYDGLVDESSFKSLEEHIEELKSSPLEDVWKSFTSGFKMGMARSQMFVGFRIEKGTDSTESASNSTGESSLASLLKSRTREAKDKAFSISAGTLGEGGITGLLTATFNSVRDILKGAANALHVSDLASVVKGSGYLDIPELWQDSSFSKSYSFNMTLYALYSDPFSIFYNLYTPLALIMGGTFPRAVGPNSYTSPFVVRAYCRGMFAVPMGIIDSITITRGDSEYGWSYDFLPLKLKISFTIKDLSPILYMPLNDSAFRTIFGMNSPFQEYMLTLSGVGLAERILFMDFYKKRIEIAKTIFKNNKLNPMMYGFSLGNNRLFQAISSFLPKTNMPTK